jgi:aspartyl-tRNA(Asn)/glutamyl-tRNA(Gln) amidotransferase subunit A
MNTHSWSRRSFLAAGLGAGAAALAARPGFAAPQNLAGLSIKQASDLLRSRGASPVDLVKACLDRIDKYNPSLNAFITVTGDQALATAKEMEAEQRRGKWRGPLHGIPIALKDNIDTAGIRTTGASELFKERMPEEDAEVVRRLKDAGAILLGKLNLHEFAYGATSTVSYFGAVHNPWALDRVAGGSSGGAAAAVAADLCFGALGTDTAGSIRLPACCCGVVGLKGTYGRVSNRGVIPLSWTHDHVGPLCKTVEDAALMLGAIAGYDQQDPTTRDMPVSDYSRAIGMPTAKLRLGIPRSPFFENLDPQVARAVDAALEVLTTLTSTVVDVNLPPGGFRSSGVYLNVRGPEAYTYHARFLAESPGKYQEATRKALEAFAETKFTVYAQARRQVDLLRREILSVFSRVDLLIAPTMLAEPVPIAESGKVDAVDFRNTVPFNTYGLPAITIPCGFTRSGLPIGLQIAGPPFGESLVLSLAHAYEQATPWHSRHPNTTSA